LKSKPEIERPVGVPPSSPPTGSHNVQDRPPSPGRNNFAVRSWRAFPRLRWVIIGLVVVLGTARLFLPFAVERYVNRQLNRAQDYGGRIGSVHIQLWRGRYRINDPSIFKRSGGVHVPLFSANGVYLAIEWKELFHGSIVGQVIMDQPRVNFVAGPTADQAQTGENEDWSAILKSLFPFELNRFEIIDGEIHFQNEHSTPPVDIYLSKLSSVATNLTNSRKVKDELPAGVTAHGTTLGGGGLDLQLQLNPMTQAPTYQVVAQLTNVDMLSLNNFLRAYGKFDVERGKFALFASVASKDNNYDGYLKVFFENLKVFAWDKERHKDALQIFWDAIVGTVTTIFKNHSTDSLATRVPISGTYSDKKVGMWTAVGTLLRHAFIRALVPKLDQKVTLHDVQQNVDERKKLSPSPPPVRGAEKLTKPDE
jgi:hypothetical protein